jgi:hypothetical protein
VTGGPYLNVATVRVGRIPFRDVVPITTLNVDVVTTQILAETDLSMYDSALLTFINDGASDYTVTLTTGEVTLAIDAVFTTTIVVPAKSGSNPGQNTFTVGPSNMRRFWRATGVAATALTAARFQLKGVPR